jgi:hypothetical protein
MKMKALRWLLLVATGIVFAGAFNSCKKGPEDPFFSIWSRKHRVVGDWQVTEFKVDFVDSIRRVLLAETILGACGQQVDSVIWTYDYEFSFTKDGAVSLKTTVYKDTTIDIINNTAACPDVALRDSISESIAQSWNFTGNIGDYKNKEQLVIFDPETKETMLFDIIGLHEKEMKLRREEIDPVTNVQHIWEYTLSKI